MDFSHVPFIWSWAEVGNQNREKQGDGLLEKTECHHSKNAFESWKKYQISGMIN
jgi:hypothetical protein